MSAKRKRKKSELKCLILFRPEVDTAEMDDESKREASMTYERKTKKKDPEKLKAIFSSPLEQSIMPTVSKILFNNI